MDAEKTNGGSLKAFVILFLLAANIALAVFAHPGHQSAPSNRAPQQTPRSENYVARP